MLDSMLEKLAVLIVSKLVEQIPAIATAVAKEVTVNLAGQVSQIPAEIVNQITANIPFLKKK